MKVNRRRFLAGLGARRSAPSPRARPSAARSRRRPRPRPARRAHPVRRPAPGRRADRAARRGRARLAGRDRRRPRRARRRPAGAQRPGARAHAGLARCRSREPDEPPLDSGALGTEIAPDALTVTIGFGASLFDERYGLKAPEKLERMTPFDGDQLDPAAHPRRRDAPDQRAQHGHGLARAARAAAPDARRARAALVDRRLPGRRTAGRTSAARAATCSASATAPATPTPATTR